MTASKNTFLAVNQSTPERYSLHLETINKQVVGDFSEVRRFSPIGPHRDSGGMLQNFRWGESLVTKGADFEASCSFGEAVSLGVAH